MKLLLSLALVVSSVAATVAQNRPSFPVPRAEQEFVALFPHIEGYGGAIRNDQKAFVLAVLPYAPLDLQITKAQNYEEADTLRNFYLGVAGAASGIDSAALAKIASIVEKAVLNIVNPMLSENWLESQNSSPNLMLCRKSRFLLNGVLKTSIA